MNKDDNPQSDTSFKKKLSLTLLIFYGVGTILGLGIYVLLGKVAGEAGMLAPIAFLAAAVIAGFTALSYGELSARIPKSAGEVYYVDTAFGSFSLSLSVGWLIVLSGIISTATVVNGYVGYVQVFLEIPDWVIITGIIVLLSAVAVWGIAESAYTITVITIIEVLGILLVIAIAGDNLSALPERWPELVPSFSYQDWSAILAGAFLAFFSFIGFEDMVNVAEEAKNPKRDMPKAIMISLALLTLLYFIVAVIASMGLTPEQLNNSEAPLADILAQEGESYPEIISAIGTVAIVNGVLVQIVMIARVLYGMANKKMAPALFGNLNTSTRTPLKGTIITSLVILFLALSFDLKELAQATNYILLIVFIFVNLALWRIQKKDPNPKNVKTYGPWVPVLGFILSLGVLLFQLYTTLYP